MTEFTVKEVADQVDTSTQYIYQKVPYLIENGLAYRDEKGKPIIYDVGIEYLRNKRMQNLKVANKGLQNSNVENGQNEVNTEKNDFAISENIQQVIDIYKNLYEEQKREKEHWRELYIEKDKALTEITSKCLLPPTQEESKKKKWKFWER